MSFYKSRQNMSFVYLMLCVKWTVHPVPQRNEKREGDLDIDK